MRIMPKKLAREDQQVVDTFRKVGRGTKNAVVRFAPKRSRLKRMS